MEYITLKERTGLKRFGIKTPDGEDTGKYIEIDMEDLDLPLKANECQVKHIENFNKLKTKMAEINKMEDTHGENDIITEKQKAALEAYKEFYTAEEDALDTFLGDGATKNLLNGRKPYLMMYDDINEYLKQILPQLKQTQKNLEERIKTKYGEEKEDNIL